VRRAERRSAYLETDGTEGEAAVACRTREDQLYGPGSRRTPGSETSLPFLTAFGRKADIHMALLTTDDGVERDLWA